MKNDYVLTLIDPSVDDSVSLMVGAFDQVIVDTSGDGHMAAFINQEYESEPIVVNGEILDTLGTAYVVPEDVVKKESSWKMIFGEGAQKTVKVAVSKVRLDHMISNETKKSQLKKYIDAMAASSGGSSGGGGESGGVTEEYVDNAVKTASENTLSDAKDYSDDVLKAAKKYADDNDSDTCLWLPGSDDGVKLSPGSNAAGGWSVCEGRDTEAIGLGTHSEGDGSTAHGTGTHAEGINTKAYSNGAHAEGRSSHAMGLASHAEGSSYALAPYSHAEGDGCVAYGSCSHAEGRHAYTDNNYSHAECGSDQQIQFMLTNSVTESKRTTDKTVSEGDLWIYRNGVGVYWYENGLVTSSPIYTAGRDSTTGKLVLSFAQNPPANTLLTLCASSAKGKSSHSEGAFCIAQNECSHSEGYATSARGECAHSEGSKTLAEGSRSHAEGLASIANGLNSHAEGSSHAVGSLSHSEGGHMTGVKVEYIDSGTLRLVEHYDLEHNTPITNYAATDYVGKSFVYANGQHGYIRSVTEDNGDLYFTIVHGTSFDIPPAPGSIIDGRLLSSVSIGYCSHSECVSSSMGSYSHSEGMHTKAKGDASHAEGSHTIAGSTHQHVEGRYNVEDDQNTYAHIVGNGTDEANRSNALTLDWSGNLAVSGSIQIGSTRVTEAQLQALLALLN